MLKKDKALILNSDANRSQIFQYQYLGIDYSRYNNTKCSSNDHDWRNCAKSWQKIYVNSIHATFGYCTGFMVSIFDHVHDGNEMQCGYKKIKKNLDVGIIIRNCMCKKMMSAITSLIVVVRVNSQHVPLCFVHFFNWIP